MKLREAPLSTAFLPLKLVAAAAAVVAECGDQGSEAVPTVT